MYLLRKLITAMALTGAAAALCTGTALAADADAIAAEATVTADTVSLLEAADEDSEEVYTLEQSDTVVLLSQEEDGLYAAAYVDEDEEVYSGYVESDAVSLESQGQVTILTDDAVMLAETDEDSDTITTLGQGATLQVLGYEDGWFYVRAKGKTGYVPLSDVSCTVVTTSDLNLRSGADEDSKVLEVLDEGVTLTPTAAQEGWYQVSYDGEEGYVSSNYVTPEEEDSFTVESPVASTGEAVLAYAQQFLGNPYVWGGTSLTNGCDCSGYVMQIYAKFGVSLPHSSSAIRSCGTKVSYSEMQVGDVVCYNGHVGIYAGDGKIINALNSRSGICYTDVNYSTIVSIRRML